MRRLSYKRWIDDPNERLAGLSPREAAGRPEHREQLERQLRSLEHHDARERGDGRPRPEVAWLRAELGLTRARVAAWAAPRGSEQVVVHALPDSGGRRP